MPHSRNKKILTPEKTDFSTKQKMNKQINKTKQIKIKQIKTKQIKTKQNKVKINKNKNIPNQNPTQTKTWVASYAKTQINLNGTIELIHYIEWVFNYLKQET